MVSKIRFQISSRPIRNGNVKSAFRGKVTSDRNGPSSKNGKVNINMEMFCIAIKVLLAV